MEIAAPDVNLSEAYFSVKGNKILFGLDGIQNVGENAVNGIIEARRKGGPFRDISDFLERVDSRGLNSRACESLIRCGALDSLGRNRSQLLAVLPEAMSNAQSVREDRESGQVSLFGDMDSAKTIIYPPLPDIPQNEKSNGKESCWASTSAAIPWMPIKNRWPSASLFTV